MTDGFGCNGCDVPGCPNYRPKVVLPKREPPLCDDECQCVDCTRRIEDSA